MVEEHRDQDSQQNEPRINATLKQKRTRREEYQQLLVSFVLMLTFTVIAFLAIGTESIPALFAIPFVLFLAVTQVVLQLFIFMHLKERGSGYSIIFITAGIFIGVITIAALIHARTL